MTLLISQVIRVAFHSEPEKSDKFCSEALILAWGSFKCRKSTTRDPWIYFPSEGSHTQDFYALKKSIDPDQVWTREPRIRGKYDNHWTTGVNWVCVLCLCSILYCLWQWPWHCADHTLKEACLVYLSSVLIDSRCSSYRNLIHGHLSCKFWGCKFYIGGG